MARPDFIFKSLYMEVYALYSGSKSYGWDYRLDFETGTYNCRNYYGTKTYNLTDEELLVFEKEVVGSHMLEWTQEGLSCWLDVRNWYVKYVLADGTTHDVSGSYKYKYNYLRLERAFILTESYFRGGGLGNIDHLKKIVIGDCLDYEEALEKYTGEFKTDQYPYSYVEGEPFE